MLKLENVRKNYDRFTLECSLEVQPGCITGLVGQNGAGKSTTFKAILGLIHTDGGRITLLGCRPGCYVYSYGYQAPLPALQQAALAVREQYNILYSEFYDGLTLTFEN